MNLSTRGFSEKDAKFNISSKVTTLNPNAAEFVPSALRSTFGNTRRADPTGLDIAGPSGKSVLDRSESTLSNNSDDEAHQYWCRQLPDDITPDFKVIVEDESQTPEQLSLAGLSIHNGIETSRFSASSTYQLLGTRQNVYCHGPDSLILTGKTGFSGVIYAQDQPSAAFMTSTTNNWEKRVIHDDHQFTIERSGDHYNVDSGAAFSKNLLSEHVLENSNINPLELLASQFPGFAAESLADAYYANGCDLNLTMKILPQLAARQAYLARNKALAKELSIKEQLYSMQMKAAHEKAREGFYQQRRNSVASEVVHSRVINLQGLHASEAIHVLRRELSIVRRTMRSARERVQLMVSLGTLQVAVEQYLLEEGLPYTQPQPGLLEVVIY